MIHQNRSHLVLKNRRHKSFQWMAIFFFIESSVVCFGSGTVPNTESEDAEMLKNIDLLKHMDLLQNFDLIEGQSNIDQASASPSGSQTYPSNDQANPNAKSKGKSL